MILGPNGQPINPEQIQGPFSAKNRPGYNVPFGEVRDWRKIGWSVYHDTQHPLHPWDTEAVRLFREEVDYTMVPLWVRSTYRNVAGGVYTFDRHVITVYNHLRAKVHPDLRAITATAGGHVPNMILEILGDRGGVLPGPFVPFGMLHYYKYKELVEIAQHTSIARDHHDYIQGRLDKIQKIDEQAEAESNYRWNQDWGYLKRLAGQLTAEEEALVARASAPGVH